MATFGVKEEARINRARQPRVTLCGSCGAEVSKTELICADCRGEVFQEEAHGLLSQRP